MDDIIVILNGKPMAVAPGTTLAQLKEAANLPVHNVAVAVNDRIIPASKHPDFKLENGHNITVIGAAYGG